MSHDTKRLTKLKVHPQPLTFIGLFKNATRQRCPDYTYTFDCGSISIQTSSPPAPNQNGTAPNLFDSHTALQRYVGLTNLRAYSDASLQSLSHFSDFPDLKTSRPHMKPFGVRLDVAPKG